MIEITIADQVTPEVRKFIAALEDRRALHAEMGMAVETQVLRHIRTVKVPQKNRLGATSTGFWQRALASVKGDSDNTGATVRIPARGVALQYYGGTVRAQNKPWLTIPIHAAAHGKRAFEIGKPLYRFMSKAGNWILATDPTGGVRSGRTRQRKERSGPPRYRGGVPLYVLKKSVSVRAHEDVLPTQEAMGKTAADAASAYVGRRLPR